MLDFAELCCTFYVLRSFPFLYHPHPYLRFWIQNRFNELCSICAVFWFLHFREGSLKHNDGYPLPIISVPSSHPRGIGNLKTLCPLSVGSVAEPLHPWLHNNMQACTRGEMKSVKLAMMVISKSPHWSQTRTTTIIWMQTAASFLRLLLPVFFSDPH